MPDSLTIGRANVWFENVEGGLKLDRAMIEALPAGLTARERRSLARLSSHGV